MSKIFKITQVLLVAGLMAACAKRDRHDETAHDVRPGPPPPIEAPATDIPGGTGTETVKEGKKSCHRPEETQYLSSEALTNRALLTETIENWNMQKTDCSGHVQHIHGPSRQLIRSVKVESLNALQRHRVKTVRIENQRTCMTLDIPTASDTSVEDEIELLNGQTIRFSPLRTKAGGSGVLKLVVTDGDVGDSNEFLKVEDGINAVRVSYLDDGGRLLGTRDIIIDVRVDRPEVSGEHLINGCRRRTP